MPKKKNLPYGTWPSKITPEVTGDLRDFSELCWNGDGRLLWVERYSNHSSLMAWDEKNGEISKVSGGHNVSGNIMYGGGSYSAVRDQVVYVEKGSSHIYYLPALGAAPQKLPCSGKFKSSPQISPCGKNLAYIHSDGENDSIKIIDLSGNQVSRTFDAKSDFYNYPRWHPDATHIAWISWDHPHMPWHKSHLSLVELNHGQHDYPQMGSQLFSINKDQVSMVQPEFSPDGQYLAYLSDKSGWWQLFLYQIDSTNLEKLTHAEADHCLPPWLQNQRFFSFSPDSQHIYCIRNSRGFASLWKINTDTKNEKQINLPGDYTWLESIAVSPENGSIALVASGGSTPSEILVIKSKEETTVIRSNTRKSGPGTFSKPEAISLQDQQGDKLHGLFYKPQNPEYRSNGKPPLLIIVHSGPTRQKYAEFQPRAQFFTSRGYAVLEINYRGSTGYGRDYWEALEGQWGILDVRDVYEAANTLSREGIIDKKRIALLGSSSGGLTVLQLLVKYPEFFRACISLYGVTNLNELIKNPPKFERYYHDWLVGDPINAAAEYHNRSPLYAANMIRTPIAIFQGAKDPIVPREQAEQIVEVLKKNGVQHEYNLYLEEGHGFKKSENVCDFYEKTVSFLSKHLLDR